MAGLPAPKASMLGLLNELPNSWFGLIVEASESLSECSPSESDPSCSSGFAAISLAIDSCAIGELERKEERNEEPNGERAVVSARCLVVVVASGLVGLGGLGGVMVPITENSCWYLSQDLKPDGI